MNLRIIILLSFWTYFNSLFGNEGFKTNRVIYTPKSLLFFTIELNKDSYVYILNETVSGTLHLVFPNPEDPENYFLKGVYRIPSKNARYEFEIEEDVGEETFYFLVSRVPISKFHIRNFRESEALNRPQWLRRFTSELHPLDWKIYEQKIKIVNTR